MKHVLVTGGGGFIGSRMIGDFLDAGYRVTCLDRFFFGRDIIAPFLNHDCFNAVRKDIRNVTVTDFEGVDVVVDLAGISNDPSCDLDSFLTESINHYGSVHVARTAKDAGVQRYILASSCSIYGAGSNDILNENSEMKPVSLYARSKINAEQDIRSFVSPDFCATFLRLATVFGVSPRMRFDLIVNIMTMHAYQSNRIIIMGGGKQWRPLVHVADVSRAFLNVLKVSCGKINGEAFNVGSNGQNYQVFQVANLIKSRLKNVEVVAAPDDLDKRSYHVNFDKIHRVLGFETTISVSEGIDEIHEALKNGKIEPGDIRCVTVKYYRYLIEADRLLNEIKVDGRLF